MLMVHVVGRGPDRHVHRDRFALELPPDDQVVVAGLIDFDMHDCGIHTTKLDAIGLRGASRKVNRTRTL